MNYFCDLSGKSIVITGAASGIGRVTAQSIAQAGANVILLDINEQGLIQTQKQVKKQKSLVFPIDLKKYEQFEEIIKQSVNTFGKLHGFVHSAGIEYTLPVKSMKHKQYLELFEINAVSGFEIAKIISKKKYVDSNRASFIFIASIMSLVGRKGLTGYSASKGAVIAAVRSMALELAAKKINVNCISPGTIETELIKKFMDNLDEDQRIERLKGFPLGIGKPEDVANAAIFLLSDKASWITGTNLVVDGGYTAQ